MWNYNFIVLVLSEDAGILVMKVSLMTTGYPTLCGSGGVTLSLIDSDNISHTNYAS